VKPSNDPEIELIGADREPVAKHVLFAGMIKRRHDRRAGKIAGEELEHS
jgi:hypothetical protein